MELLLPVFCIIIMEVSYVQGESKEPNFDVPIVNVTAIATKTAILPCSVSNLGEYKVAWSDHRGKILTFQERRVISDDRISLERPYTNDWNLFIRDVKVLDGGKYMCQINTNPVKIKHVMLVVHERASIIDASSDMETKEGSTVELICNATGIPTPVVTWYRRPLNSDESAKEVVGVDGQILAIHNISRYCEDIYECVAFNNIPPAASQEIRVTVLFAPEISLRTKRIGQTRGKETILECRITANPQVVSLWQRNGRDIQQNDKYRVEVYEEEKNTITVSLRISYIEENDYGKYTCFAANKLGQDEEYMVLYEYREPVKIEPSVTTPRIAPGNGNWISNTNEPAGRPNVKIDPGMERHPEYTPINQGYDSQSYGNGASQVHFPTIIFIAFQLLFCIR